MISQPSTASTATAARKPLKAMVSLVESSKKFPADSFAYFIGFGQSEVLVLQKANKFNKIYEFINLVRTIKYRDIDTLNNSGDSNNLPILASTYTIPLISYNNVIIPENYFLLSGDVTPYIQIKCPPGFEAQILSDNYFSNFRCRSTLGSADVSAHANSNIDASEFIPNLLDFRKRWSETCPELIDTNTTISFISENTAVDTTTYKVDHQRIPDYSNLNAISKYFGDFEESLPIVAYQVNDLAGKLNSYLRNKLYGPSASVLMYAPLRILGEIELYEENKHDIGEANYYKGNILQLLDNLENALSQCIESRFPGSLSSTSYFTGFADGVLASIFALDQYAHEIYRIISGCYKNINYWKGYTFFDRRGFQHYHGDVFSLPPEAITSVFSPDVNWLTLTHEISHAIFTIIGTNETHSDEIKEAYYRAVDDDSPTQNEFIFSKVRDEIYELFANWFDYYHFYNEDHNFYQISIWNSWDTVPFVNQEKVEYVTRSFAIYSLQDIDEYLMHVCAGTDNKFIIDKWNDYTNYLKDNLPKIHSKYINDSISLDVMSHIQRYFLPLTFILNDSKNPEFKGLVNKGYTSLDKHISLILQGTIIDESDDNVIENPFLLIRECTRMLSNDSTLNKSAASCAIIFSLKNRCNFLGE
jgi:hypothetical protein